MIVRCCTFALDLSRDVFGISRVCTHVRECTIWNFLAPSCFVALDPIWGVRTDETCFPVILCGDHYGVIDSEEQTTGYREALATSEGIVAG